MSKIDYTGIHNNKCAFFSYLKNFLKQDAPEDQIFEELTRLVLDVAYTEADANRDLNKQRIEPSSGRG